MKLHEAVETGDLVLISRESHELKGIFLTIGAADLAEACGILDDIGERGDRHAIESALEWINQTWGTLREEASRLRETRPGPTLEPGEV